MRERVLSRQGVSRFIWGLVALLVGGCATLTQISEDLTQISEKGGLFGGAFSREASSDPGDPPEGASAAPRGASLSEPGIPVPYRPADFRDHAADGEFAWHWTASRAGERVEVKGLIENKGARAVQGVIFALSSPDSQVRAEAPGLIRPGQLRPFYFAAVLPGDERQARLSIVAVNRTPLEPDADPSASPAPRRGGPIPARSTAELFTDQHRDNFFTLRWNTTKKGGEIEVSGLVENRNGPLLGAVHLLISAYGAGGEALKTKRLVLWGPFDKKAVRPFAATLPVAKEPEHVSVAVASYEFFHPSGEQ